MTTLDARLKALQDKYAELSARTKAEGSSTLDMWPAMDPATATQDLWSELYAPWVQWIAWRYVIPSNDDMLALVHFNVAVDIHRAMSGLPAYDAEAPEPVLEWLPKVLCTAEDAPCGDAVPLWPRERLAAYIAGLPQQDLLQRHAIPRGLVGVVRGVPRAPPLDLSNLVQGQGWAPAPDVVNYQQTAAMLVSGAPLDMDALFGTM